MIEVNEKNYIINNKTTEINEDDESMYVSGGYSVDNDVTNNTVNITGGNIYGVTGGSSSNGNAINNSINVTNGIIEDANIYGGESWNGNAIGNIINISGGTIYGEVYGGYSHYGDAMDNRVNITGGTIDGWERPNGHHYPIHGIYGGVSLYKDVSNNTVTIDDGTFTRTSICGGYSDDGNVENNTVNIYGGNFTLSDIVGGITRNGNATNNTVNISGNPNLSVVGLYGGEGNTSSGNTLNVYTKNLTVECIFSFQNINFYLPENTVNGDTILNVNYGDISGATIRAGVVGNANLKNGDVVTLINCINGLNYPGLSIDDTTTYGKLTEGVSLEYDLSISQVGNSIVATVGNSQSTVENSPSALINPNITLNPETEILPVSGVMPGVGTIDTSMNTPTIEDDKEFESEGAEVAAQIVEPKGWEIFANMGGGTLKTKGSDGSHVDMTTQSINLGFARSLESSAGKFTIAPIIDYANGNYDSYLETGVHGSGKTRYIAGGLIARRMLDNGFYYEGSVRVGKVKTDFASNNIDKTGMFGRVTYDTSATTLAGHLKLGKAFRLNKNNFLDVYGIYYHAHQNGMSADLSSGEHYDFSSANSGRFRIGYRLTTKTSKISKIYTGLAYQYEHSSGVTATYKTYSTAGKSENGSSGMLEVGWIIKPLKSSPFAVDINTTGWIGHQRGITAMAKIQKSF